MDMDHNQGHDVEEDHGNRLDEMDVENTLSQRDLCDFDDVGGHLFAICMMLT